MNKKKLKIFFILIFLISIFLLFLKSFDKKNKVVIKSLNNENPSLNTNIIANVNYSSKDTKGNEYHVKALKGEIDNSNPEIIYLTEVETLIDLYRSDSIKIVSSYGKYNSSNLDIIFSENVIIYYLDNTITADYLDFSLQRNSMFVSGNVVMVDSHNKLSADVVEIDIESKNTKIFMYENDKKVNIKTKEKNGGN
jgi:lipopolysaccharide export system protein LptA